MKRFATAAICAVALLAGGRTASAQGWNGLYVGGFIGGGFQKGDRSEAVRFDTNLDGTFTDTVRTAAGADAFSPGFCGGLAINAVAASGCLEDENSNEVDFGGRVGYDWQMGRLVIGGLVDVSRSNVTDTVTAFSTTPAFYAFTRELNALTGFRGRVGFGNNRMMVYGTAGGAWARIEQTFTTSNRVNTFVAVNQGDGDTENAWGYQAGGGAEFKLARHWSLTGEYLFSSLDNRDASTIRSQGPAPATNAFILVNAAGTDLRRSERFEIQSARVSLSSRF